MKRNRQISQVLVAMLLLLSSVLSAKPDAIRSVETQEAKEKTESDFTKSEQNLRRTADECFKAGDYQTALELYKSLLMTHPDLSDVNYRLGACYFYTNDMTHARKYLTGETGNSGALLLLGDLAMRQYDFDEALSYYERAESQTPTRYMAEVCGRRKKGVSEARKMLGAVQKVTILDSVKVTKQTLFTAMNRREDMGQVYRLNKAKEFRPRTGYMTVRKDRCYEADTTEHDGLDIRVKTLLVGGGWSEPQTLLGDVNTRGDENFPFLMEDGVSLYFASTHHNSIGGYDLYLTRTNDRGAFMKPVHLGMPFNSTWNDYLMEIDEEKREGWWVTDRFQRGDTLMVYTFKYEDEAELLSENASYATRLAWATLRRSLADTAATALTDSIADTATVTAEADLESLEEMVPETPAADVVPENMAFEIMEGVVYHDLKDFQSGEAKAYYQRGVQLEQEREKYIRQLAEKREAYQTEKDKLRKGQLGREIIVLERRLGSGSETAVEKNYRQARNCEIRKLKLNR
ncbi:MAG: tetratricopeptide repeat protein [Paludibacteraceae bacterium]|nr:tetratricopeptide repeat protein [Paludibacteraceae bacterium]